MKNTVFILSTTRDALKITGLLLSVLFCAIQASAEVTGPVVGFARMDVKAGPQHIEPTVQPFTPHTDQGETKAQMLTDYLGKQFVSDTNVIEADWIGVASAEDDSDEVTMMWRDQQGQWRNLTGEAIELEGDNFSEFWLDLAFEASEATGTPTRELVLTGQVVW